MKKQYWYPPEPSPFRSFEIQLYRDGKLYQTCKIWLDEKQEFIENLEEKGYTRGYLPEEVQEAEEYYLSRKEREINVSEEQM